MSEDGGESPFDYHLELTPVELAAVHGALRQMLEVEEVDPGADPRLLASAAELLERLPDDDAIATIPLGDEPGNVERLRPPEGHPDGEGPGPSAA